MADAISLFDQFKMDGLVIGNERYRLVIALGRPALRLAGLDQLSQQPADAISEGRCSDHREKPLAAQVDELSVAIRGLGELGMGAIYERMDLGLRSRRGDQRGGRLGRCGFWPLRLFDRGPLSPDLSEGRLHFR